ncbi:MAG: M20 family metallopeptidase [Planctomycetes bacterium]|nr:M20 family metallopeptidase [Planctomycetota bacterium]
MSVRSSRAPSGQAAVELLQEMVRIPSVSGEEETCRDALADWLRGRGVSVTVSGRNVLAEVVGTASAPPGVTRRGLLLCSHIDVVPVGPGWTHDPWSGEIADGRLLGRGSNDAKSSVAAMAAVAAALDPAAFAGRLVLALVCDEETGGEGIEACVHELPPVDACVVGEPTELDVCPGQRGLLRASVIAHGRSAHASRPWEGRNAVDLAARDVLAIHALDLGVSDRLLGPPTLQCTVVHGGTRPNVLPGECVVQLDGRPTPDCDNERMLALLRGVVGRESEVVVHSERFHPVRIGVDAEIVRVAKAASPTGRVRGFGGVSDLFHLRHVPGVVMGPGTSKASHAPDEWVALEQVHAAVTAYDAIARRFLGVHEAAGAGEASDETEAEAAS